MTAASQSIAAINLQQKLAKITEHWQPRVIAELNDYQLKLVKLEGEFVWHRHEDTDELFVCIGGSLTIELRNGSVRLEPGELFVVPRGVDHRPVADTECHVMLIEPRGVANTGDAGGDRTAPTDIWI